MFDNRLKELEGLSNSIEELLAVLELENKAQRLFDCLKRYYPIIEKHRTYMLMSEFRYKDDLYIRIGMSCGNPIIHCTKIEKSELGSLRIEMFKIEEHSAKSIIFYRNNEVFIDCLNNWDKYFPTFEDSFIIELKKATLEEIKNDY